MARLVGNALIGQSGGPTCVINRSLVACVEELRKAREVTGIWGARHGVEGILKEEFVDMKGQSPAALAALLDTPSAMLGSSRKKPKSDDCQKIFEVFKKRNVRYFFYIGGNDSAQTANIINELARGEDYQFRTFHIPKTIDNDLLGSDHTPGYGTAARFVASAFMGDDLDNRALKGVKINVVMGRHAGYLTASSVLGKLDRDSGPHLVYCPERKFSMRRFITDVDRVYRRLGRCVVAVSEGINKGKGARKLIVYEAGMVMLRPGVRKELPKDEHGNPQLSGTGILADYLVYRVRKALEPKYEKTGKKLRVRGDTFGYLQRSFPGVMSEVDAREATAVGKAAARFSLSADIDGSVVIRRKQGRRYAVEIDFLPLTDVAQGERRMSKGFINAAGNYVTKRFINYALPLIGKMPKTGLLKAKPVKKRR
ncbi:MAG TPA: 6-phosphofructokinase [Planctomycetota bacterium]|nr:6-phosphofructokinase [Planctomycetota bacterium]